MTFGMVSLKDDSILLQKVSKKLFSVIDNPPQGKIWPPTIELIQSKEVNGYASFDAKQNRYKITMTSSLFDTIILGKSSRLAYVVSHELGHIISGHCSTEMSNSSNVFYPIYNRDFEKQADIE